MEIVTIITSAITLLGTILTVILTSNRNSADIQELKADVKELKDYNARLCVVENQISTLKELMTEIKGRIDKHE